MAKYIHSLPDWPQFRWSHDALASKLAAVRHLKLPRFRGVLRDLVQVGSAMAASLAAS
jgi:hypothetical protein